MEFFAHIPKAGGSTIKSIYFHAFGVDNCLKVWPQALPIKDFKSVSKAELLKHSAIIGHLPIPEFMKNVDAKNMLDKGDISILTVVRDPVDRLISLYNYICATDFHPRHTDTKQMHAYNFLISEPENFQHTFLGGNETDDIPSYIRIIPLHLSINVISWYLFDKYGKKQFIVNKKNVTKDLSEKYIPFKKEELNQSQLDHLLERHQLDLSLCETAANLYLS